MRRRGGDRNGKPIGYRSDPKGVRILGPNAAISRISKARSVVRTERISNILNIRLVL